MWKVKRVTAETAHSIAGREMAATRFEFLDLMDRGKVR